MRKLIVLFSLFSCVFANAQFVVNSYAFGGFLPPPNAANPNPELFLGDAASFESETDIITAQHGGSGVTVTAESDVSNGYGSFVAKALATSTGTLKRDWVNVSGTWTVGEIYEVYILERHNNTTDSGRYRMSIGSSSGDQNNTHAAHTAWTLHNFEFTADGATPRIDVFARNTVSTIVEPGEYVEYKLSVKLKND